MNVEIEQHQPSIIVLTADYERLIALAAGMRDRLPAEASELLSEMERAEIAENGTRHAPVVQMGSTVRFRTGSGQERQVTVVFPGEADIAQGKISILTPIGTALIGLTTGQSITFTSRYGRVQELQVVSIEAHDSSPA